jgi:hypothetical protein
MIWTSSFITCNAEGSGGSPDMHHDDLATISSRSLVACSRGYLELDESVTNNSQTCTKLRPPLYASAHYEDTRPCTSWRLFPVTTNTTTTSTIKHTPDHDASNRQTVPKRCFLARSSSRSGGRSSPSAQARAHATSTRQAAVACALRSCRRGPHKHNYPRWAPSHRVSAVSLLEGSRRAA